MAVLASAATAFAEPAKPAAPKATPIPLLQKKIDFESQVLPIFRRNCLACHNATDSQGDLVLETPATIKKGGKSGPVAEPKNSLESLLLQTAAKQEKPFMPPKNNKVGAEVLKPEELAILRTWIEQGATGVVKARTKPLEWKPLPPGLHPILALAITPDGQYAACGRANQIFIYRVPTGQVVARLTDPKLAEKTGRSGYKSAAQHDFVQSLAFSPDGLLLASGEYRQVKLWQREPNLPQFSLGAAPASVLVVSPDKKWIATAGADKVIRLWQAANGQAGPELKGHEGAIASLRFSQDGTRLASGAADKTVRIWEVATGKVFAQVEAPQPVTAVAWLLGDKEVAAADGENVIRHWQLPAAAGGEMAPQKEIGGHTAPVTCLDTQPDGKQLLSGSQDKSARLWAVEQGGRSLRQVDAGAPVTAVALSPNGKTIATVSGNAVRLWASADRGAQLAELKGDHRARFAQAEAERQVAFEKDNVAYWKTTLDAATKAQPTRAEAVKKATEALAAATKTATEKRAAIEKAADEKAKADAQSEASKADTATKAATVALEAAKDLVKQADQALADAKAGSAQSAEALQKANAALEKAKKAATDSEKPIRAVAFSPDSTTLATAGDDQIIHTWAAETGVACDTFPSQVGAVDALAYTTDGRLLSAAAKAGPVVWRSGPNWTLARTIGTGDEKSPIANRVLALDFSKDGQRIATGGGVPSRSGEVKIWRVSDGGLVREITPSHSDSVYGLDFSPDGKLLATASADKFVKIFDTETGKLVKQLSGHTHYVMGVCWRADGRMLASSGADHAVKLWSYPEGVQVKSVEDFKKEVTNVRFLGLGRELLVASGEARVRMLKEDGSNLRDYPGSKGFIFTTAATPDGQVILGGGQDSILRLWQGPTGKVLYTLDPPAPDLPVVTPAPPAR